MSMLQSAFVATLIALGPSATCGAQLPQKSALTAPCDSARAAHIVLDSLDRLNFSPSAVYRLTRDTLGMRFVTMPDHARLEAAQVYDSMAIVILDGMAIVHVNAACRIVRLVQTDSA